MTTTSNQHKQTKTKPYTKGFNAGAMYAFSEYKVLFAWYIRELHTASSMDGASDEVLSHINHLHSQTINLTFPEFIGEAPDRRNNSE
jgi:hypothetical protein